MGAWAVGSKTETGASNSAQEFGFVLNGIAAADDDLLYLAFCRLLADRRHCAADFSEQCPLSRFRLARVWKPHRAEQYDRIVSLRGKIGFVRQWVDNEGNLFAIDHTGATNHGRGRAAADRNPVKFHADRFADFTRLGHPGSVQCNGKNLIRRFGVARQRNEVECRLGAQRRKLALGLKADHFRQFIRRRGGQRHELHLDVVATNTNKRCQFAGHFARYRGGQPRHRFACRSAPRDPKSQVKWPTPPATDTPVGPEDTSTPRTSWRSQSMARMRGMAGSRWEAVVIYPAGRILATSATAMRNHSLLYTTGSRGVVRRRNTEEFGAVARP